MNPVKKKFLLFFSLLLSQVRVSNELSFFCFALLNVVTVVTKILKQLIFVIIDLDFFFSLIK